MRIAIYGGSFNPMHIGHEKIVDYVLNNLNMDKIIIIPVGIPSHRENNLEQSDTRLKICKEIFKGNKKIELIYGRKQYKCQIKKINVIFL